MIAEQRVADPLVLTVETIEHGKDRIAPSLKLEQAKWATAQIKKEPSGS